VSDGRRPRRGERQLQLGARAAVARTRGVEQGEGAFVPGGCALEVEEPSRLVARRARERGAPSGVDERRGLAGVMGPLGQRALLRARVRVERGQDARVPGARASPGGSSAS